MTTADVSTTPPISDPVRHPRGRERRTPRDLRRVWRIVLAVLAPVPMASMGIAYLFSPLRGDSPFADLVSVTAGHRTTMAVVGWLGVPFLVLLVPATGVLIWVTRRAAPRLATAGGVLAVLGFCAGFSLLPSDTVLAVLTVQQGLPVEVVAALDRAWWEQPATAAASLLFIVGETIGLSLLGLALWRSRLVPRWMAVALILGAFTHPFMPHQVAAGAGLVVAAVGFAGASWALLRMSDEEFDLPPHRAEPARLSRR